MKKLDTIFNEIKTPDSWKDNLFEKAYNEKPAKSGGLFKRFSVGVAVAFGVVATTITVGAMTGAFSNIGEVFKKGFKDEVTAAKIAEGKYQTLTERCETEKAVIEATKFLGDSIESYTVLEVKLKEGVEAQQLAIDVTTLEESFTNLEDFGKDKLYSVPATNENGETVYYFNVKNYEAHLISAENNDSNLVMYIRGMYFINGEEETYEETDLTMSFNPDEEAITQVNYNVVNEKITVNGIDCTVYESLLSDYRAQLDITFSLPEGEEATWENGVEKYNGILNLTKENNFEFVPEKANMKLIVDGKEIPYIEPDFNGLFEPCSMYQNYKEADQPSNSFGIYLRFERFEYNHARSIVLEITENDGNVISVKLR